MWSCPELPWCLVSFFLLCVVLGCVWQLCVWPFVALMLCVLLTEVGVLHGLGGGQSLLVVVAEQLVQQVQGLGTHQVLVLCLYKLFPALPALSAQSRHTRRDTHS